MSFNIHDLNRNACMLKGPLRSEGYDWWWHSFTGVNVRTGEERSFFVEFFLCNPEFGGRAPTFGQLPFCRDNGVKPSYLMVKAGAREPSRSTVFLAGIRRASARLLPTPF